MGEGKSTTVNGKGKYPRVFTAKIAEVKAKLTNVPMVTMKRYYSDYVVLELRVEYQWGDQYYMRTCYIHTERSAPIAKTPLLGKIDDGRRIRRIETLDHESGDTRTDRVLNNRFIYYRYAFEEGDDIIIRNSQRANPVHYDAAEDTKEVTISELKRMML